MNHGWNTDAARMEKGMVRLLVCLSYAWRSDTRARIEPRYVQVAIDRWEAFTGRTAEQVGVAVGASGLDL